MQSSTITISNQARPVLPDGFSATVAVCEKLGLDLSGMNMALLQIFYTSGVCFGPADRMSEDARALWRNSIVWPRLDTEEARTQFSAVTEIKEKSI